MASGNFPVHYSSFLLFEIMADVVIDTVTCLIDATSASFIDDNQGQLS